MQYDYLNRLTQISSTSSATNTVSYNYSYNSANQRTRVNLVDGSYWLYQYDSLGQVISASKHWSDETPVAGQQFEYTFDNIGNRTQTQTGGDQNGMNLRLANYYANSLNQLTNRNIPAYVDIKGVSIATNTVTVNGQTAYRKVEYFRDELGMSNSSSALWTNIITAATGQTSVTGNVYVAQEPETFRYDADGNLTNDGRWAYTWDGENRLIGMTVNTNVGPQYQLTFTYDSKGRRIEKIVSTNNGSIYVPESTNNFLYDGWNLVAELNPSGSLICSYMWGSDLSGSAQGAGGVGGLLEVSYYGSSTTNCFPAFDGNGNVMALIN
ncbi:MAG: type IV secretion protein Rhs, partial [Verrucomicrobiota bacterium]